MMSSSPEDGQVPYASSVGNIQIAVKEEPVKKYDMNFQKLQVKVIFLLQIYIN